MPETEVKVSVFCIAFNHHKYLRRCLDGMVSQKTSFRYEIIVHDDASTDGTQDIIREYAAKYPDLIVPILQKENQYSQRKDIVKSFLFPAASGKYIVECEGDDYWCEENKLQLQVEALESHPECVLCVHDTETVDADGNKQEMHFPMARLEHEIIPTEEFMDLMLDENSWPFHLSAFMVSADLFHEYMDFKTVGFPSKFFRVGDLPLYLFFASKGSTFYIQRTMSVYTLESGGFMSRVKQDPQFAYKVHKGYIDGLTEFDKYSGHKYRKYVRRTLARRRFEIARIERRFDTIVRTPEFKPYIQERGFLKCIAIYAVGYMMFIFGNKKKEAK